MCKLVILPLLAVLAVSLWPFSAVKAVEVNPLPPQVPAHTASGATNITDVWLHNGGGRLYQNTLVAPRQIALEGARFVDPAAVPELTLTPPVDKKAPVRSTRKAKTAKSASSGAASHAPTAAPKGVGKTSLTAPVNTPANGAAIPPLNAAGASTAPAANAGGVEAPYSAAAGSPVGGVGGNSPQQSAGMPSYGGQGVSNQVTGSQGSAPTPAISADDVLPRANARP